MSTSPAANHRPRSVTVMVGATLLVAAFDFAIGLGLVLEAPLAGEVESAAGEVPASSAGWVSMVLSVCLLVLAVALLRGSNLSRLLLSMMLLVRIGYAWFLVTRFSTPTVLHGLPTLVVSGLALSLLWNRKANRFFETDEEEALTSTLQETDSSNRSQRVARWARDYVAEFLVLSLTLRLTPGISADAWWSVALAVALISIAGLALRPLLVRVAGLFGWLGAFALALFANAMILGAGLILTPGITLGSVGEVVLASWLYALIMTVITWAFSINQQDYLVLHAVRMGGGRAASQRSTEPGVIFVQLDGVPGPVLDLEIKAGNLPTISRWIRSGSHTWTEWVARVPSTTPVSQAGLLHGNNDDIPAFRWYEKENARLVVANHPPDAALIESRISDGAGLLVDGGVSISNLFSGDAPTSMLTMSGLKGRGKGLGPSHSYAAFFTHPAGFFRAVILTVGEVAKELFQARRQVRRDVQPRIDRKGSYVALRAVTNVFLRDLNVALIIEAMMDGAKSIYVDFVDYDEIAHHAGVTRPESMSSIFGLDSVLASLESLVASGATARPYRIVLVSDHGQSQGATFRQRYGQSLEDVVSSLMSGPVGEVTAATQEVEGWGPVNVLLDELSGQDSVSGRLTKRALGEDGSSLGESDDGKAAEGERPPLVVVGSGNLGGIWFADQPGRLLLRDIEELHPGLVQGLVDHPGIGFAVVMTVEGPVAIGREGTHLLTDGTVVGVDPLGPFGPDARADFLRVASFEHAPDIYVNSLYDPVLDEVAAFEELVGCHGGMGGWQTRPMLVYPADWDLAPDLLDEQGRLYGADVVHAQLVRWLEQLGHRKDLATDVEVAGSAL